ncbi:hypothetical protein GCM10010124_27370 [Pilimelia terevasa]|uniref:Cholesterol esterase n=1 Tax=Pilimelia terevasa TaxID=53372 RepID=A0A8J3BRB5_9ACTN|nr:DUF6230 family protein [Pilimelia terevasa]GGK33160.1 hypothetical protein GCM10010124_27370 [Pilimelia terevasa]
MRQPPTGRLHWGRAAAVGLPALAVAAGLLYAVADGLLPASLAAAGVPTKVSAGRVEGDGFVQYGDGAPVAVAGIARARLYDYCQSVRAPLLPLVLTLRAGRDGAPVTARDLRIDSQALAGRATFDDVAIGRDAGDLGSAAAGSLGQSAARVVITDLRQLTQAASAADLRLHGVDVDLGMGVERECF